MDTRALSTPSGLAYSSIEGVSVPLNRSDTMKTSIRDDGDPASVRRFRPSPRHPRRDGTIHGIERDQPSNPSLSPAPIVGLAPGVNPSNSQDRTNRSNPQDLTRPGGGNPQDLKR